ncbi:molybdopterin-dependent oxidoreductase [Algihabitans albus]|uniref:molybdopterin-dependent oxidoreductase n=1 Tax=Algihabitans albus TaxID=2164067 RepID=UPI0035D0D55F
MSRAAHLRFVVLLSVLLWAPGIAKAAEPVLLTVTGAVAQPNRDGFEPFEDALFSVLQEQFEHARTFTRSELLDLPQQDLRTRYPDWPAAVGVSGPRLLDVLRQAGVEVATGQGRVTVQAMDGYAAEFDMADITGNFLLALTMNGAPLAVGGRGPVWLVFPPASYDGQSDGDDGLAWAVFHIKVVPDS